MNLRTKQLLTTSCLTAMFVVVFAPPVALSNPMDGVVTVGNATISADGSKLNINQSSDKAVIDWRGFDIAPHEITQFYQPGSGSVTLNRVNSGSASQIDGTLIANGNIFILNQNGVMFGQGSKVDVNGLVVSTADMRNADFMAGNFALTIPGNPNASIVNNGTITAKQAGLVGLVAPQVTNNGIITAQMGRVHLASGDTATVDLYGDGLLEVAVSDHVTSQLVSNNGILAANGGTVALTAAAGRQVVNSIVNVSGDVSAMSVGQKNGKIIIGAANQAGSSVTVSGKLHAKGTDAGTKGGDVTILGDEISLLAGTDIDVSGANGGGTVLVGGDLHGLGTAYNARNTTLASGAKITADATDKGNGGKVILWGDQRTVFAGDISARGGVNGGNGGFAETSGKQHLKATGNVDLRGDNAGTWLLDPANITIYDRNHVGTDNDSTFTTSYLEDQSVNANINLEASNDFTLDLNGDTLNVTTANRLIKFVGQNRVLTASTGAITTNNGKIEISGVNGGIFINHDFRFNTGTALTQLESVNSPISFAGNLTLGGNAYIGIYGSNTVNFGGTVNGPYNLTVNANTITSNGAWGNSSALGDITLNSASSITLPAITTLAGKTVDVNVTGTGNNIQTGGIINVGTGSNLSLTSDNVQIDHDLIGSGQITLQPYNARGMRLNFYSGVYDLDGAELDHIVDGWSQINFGKLNSSYISVGDYTWKDPVYFRAAAVDLYGIQNGINNAALRINGNVTLARDITLQGGALTFDGTAFIHDTNNAVINTNGGAVTFNNGIAFNNNSGGTLSVNSTGGTISVKNFIEQRGTAGSGRYLTLNADTGLLDLTNSTINGANTLNFLGNSIVGGQAVWGNLAGLAGLSLTSNNSLNLGSYVFLSGAHFNATVKGAGNSITTGSDINVGSGGYITLTADDVNINHELIGTGVLTLQTYANNRRICIADGGCLDSSNFGLDASEIAKLRNGWSNVVIGSTANIQGMILGSSNFVDPIIFRNSSGTYMANGAVVNGTDNASFNFAGPGWVDLKGSITTQGGLISLGNTYSYGATLTTNGGNVIFRESANVGNGGGGLTVNTGGGNISFRWLSNFSDPTNTFFNLNAGSGTITFSEVVDGAFDVIAQAATINILSPWGQTNAVGNIALTSVNSLTLPSIRTVAGKTVTATATGVSSKITTSSIATGAGGNINLIANDLNITGALSGTGTLALRPYTLTTEIRVSFFNGGFNIDDTELAFLSDGWSQINIGHVDNKDGLYIGNATFKDPVAFLNGYGIYQNIPGSTLTGTGNASFSFSGNSGWLNLNGNIVTQGGSVTSTFGPAILSASSITTNGGAVSLAGLLVGESLTINTTNGSNPSGNITIGNNINEYSPSSGKTLTLNAGTTGTLNLGGAVNGAFNLTAQAGNILFNGALGTSTALGNVILTSASSLLLPEIKNLGNTLITATGAASNLTLNGAITTGGNLTLNAGQDFLITAGSKLASAGGNNSILVTAGRDITTGGYYKFNTLGTGGITFRANRNILLDRAELRTQGGDVILNSDRDADKAGNFDAVLAEIYSNGGNIVIGGGIDPTTEFAYGNAASSWNGITYNYLTLDARGTSAGGNIILNGHGGCVIDNCAGVDGSNLNAITKGAGYIRGHGISGGAYDKYSLTGFSGSGDYTTENGDIIIIGESPSIQGNTATVRIWNNLRTTGTGSIYLTAIGPTDSPGILIYGSLVSNNNIFITTDRMRADSGSMTAANSLVFRPFTDGATMAIGDNATGTLKISDAFLGRLTARDLWFGGYGAVGDAGYFSNSGAISVNTPTVFKGNAHFAGTSDTYLSNTLSGANKSFSFSHNVILLANTIIDGGAYANAITFGGTVNGSHNLTLAAESIISNGAWGAVSALGGIYAYTVNSIILPNITTLAGMDVIIDVVGNNSSITTGSIATGIGGKISLTADDLIINGNLSGTGTLTLQPYHDKAVRVEFFNGDFNLTQSEIDRFVDGWSLINIGRTDTGYIKLGNATFRDPVFFRRGVDIENFSTLTGLGNASFRFVGGTSNGNVTTNGGAITYDDFLVLRGNTVLTSNGGAITMNGINIYNDAGSFTANSNGGTITMNNRVEQTGTSAASRTVTLNAGTGTLAINNIINGAFNLLLTGNTITTNGTWGNSIGLGNVVVNAVNSIILPSIMVADGKTLDVTVSGAGKSITTLGTLRAGTLGNISLTSDDLILGGAVSGTGTLTLQTANNEAMRLNFYGGNWNLDSTEIGYLTDGWSLINIGRTDNSYIQVGNVTFRDPTYFRAPTYFYDEAGTGLVGLTDASFRFAKDAYIYGNIVTNGGGIRFDSDIMLQYNQAGNYTTTFRTNGGNVSFQELGVYSGSAMRLDVLTSGGDITVNRKIRPGDNFGNKTIHLDAGSGTVTLADTVDGGLYFNVIAGALNMGGAWGLNTALSGISVDVASSVNLKSMISSNIFVRTIGAASDITLGSGVQLFSYSSGTSLEIAAGRHFINNSGAGALGSGNGRWLVYSTNATDTTGEESLIADFKRYSCAYALNNSCANGSVLVPTTGNGYLYSYTPLLTVTPGTQSNVTYGDAANLNGYGYVLSGYLSGDTGDVVTGSLNGSTSYAQGNDIGSYNVNYASGNLASAMGYGFTYVNNATGLNVIRRVIDTTLTGLITKTYDGTDTATNLSTGNYALGNVYGSDALTITNTAGTYDNKNAGSGKDVTVSGLTLSGAKSNNYTLASSSTTGAIGNITAKALNVTATGVNKTYDGTTDGSATLSDDRIAGDILTSSYLAATFDDKNAGTGKTLNLTGISLTGTDAANYTYSSTASTTADIAQKTLTITATGVNKVYDALLAGTVNLSDDRIAGDVFTESYTAANFLDKDVGTGKTLNVTGISLSGGDSGNYIYNTTASTTADISKKSLDVTLNNQTVTYGTIVPNTTISYNGFEGSDSASDITAPTITSQHSGIVDADTYIGNYNATGGSATNYDFNIIAGNLTVGKKTLNVSADNKSMTYGDGVPLGSISFNGFISGQDESFLTGMPVVSSLLAPGTISNAGTYTGNYTVSGGSSNNYAFNYIAGDLTVTAAGLNVTAANQAVTYGTNVPTGSFTYSGFLNGDTAASVILTDAILSSANTGIVNAGSYAGNYTVSGGTTNGNYVLNYIAGDLTVAKATLNVTAGNQTVTYGTNVPTGSYLYSGFVNGENQSVVTGAPTLASAESGIVNVGSYTGNYTLSGGSALNYDFNYVAGNLTVTQKNLTITANNQTMVYGNGNNFNGYTVGSGLVGSETVTGLTLGTDATFSSSGNWNANGTPWTISASGATGSNGFLASNYNISYNAGTLTITPRALNVTASGVGKTYDGTSLASALLSDNHLAGDILSANYANAAYNDANAGTNKTINVTGLSISGTDAANYYTNTTTTTTADVAQRALTVTTDDKTKYADSGMPTFTGSNNLVAADAGFVSFFYNPAGYSGQDGTYTITATANDPSNRLANYIRTNNYGSFVVSGSAAPIIIAPKIPDSVLRNPQTISLRTDTFWDSSQAEEQIDAIFSGKPEFVSEGDATDEPRYISIRNRDRQLVGQDLPLVSASPELLQRMGTSNLSL